MDILLAKISYRKGRFREAGHLCGTRFHTYSLFMCALTTVNKSFFDKNVIEKDVNNYFFINFVRRYQFCSRRVETCSALCGNADS